MSRNSSTHVKRSRLRAAVYFVSALGGAMLAGCAQMERAADPAEPAATETPAQSPVPQTTSRPAPAAKTPPAPSASARGSDSKERGRISMYGGAFSGKKTASGEPFDPAALTMAHRTLPFGTRVRVTNLENQRSVDVVVNDRGPFVAGRIADLSEGAARRLGMVSDGVVEALLDIVEPAKSR